MSLLDRRRIPELMDDPNLDPLEHQKALAGLARLNRVSNSCGIIWPHLLKLANQLDRPIRLLDVATGSGDILFALNSRAKRTGISLEIAGCDISDTALQLCKKLATGTSIHFFQRDILQDDLPSGYDVVVCSLFLHHLDAAEAIQLLQKMQATADKLVLVNDLSRSLWNLGLIWIGTRLLTRSYVVRFDGLASIRAAWTPSEALGLAQQAGLSDAKVRRKFPCRFLLSWEKP